MNDLAEDSSDAAPITPSTKQISPGDMTVARVITHVILALSSLFFVTSILLPHNSAFFGLQGFTLASDNSNNLQSYFRSQQVSIQWLQVLRAMALELSGQVEAQDLRQIFSRVGVRFSKEVEEHFDDVTTLKALENSFNDFWSRLNWGWVDMTEVSGGIDVCHSATPLDEAFGEESAAWSHGLLEGFYQNIFHRLDGTPDMSVFEVDAAPGATHLHFRYGRK